MGAAVARATLVQLERGVPKSSNRTCDNQRMTPAEKLRAALELHDVGVELMRQNIRRRNPEASEDEVDVLLAEWLRTRPGAKYGDTIGRLRTRPLS